MSHEKQYQFLELGAGLKTTNLATIISATSTSAIAAPTVNGQPGNNGIIIYQIDWDLVGDSLVIGDNNAVDGTDRIILKTASTGNGSRVYPNGWFARENKPITILTAGATVATWVRITYTTHLPL